MKIGFRAQLNHLSYFLFTPARFASILPMLARRRSRAGSSGTVSPAAICALLRKRDSAHF